MSVSYLSSVGLDEKLSNDFSNEISCENFKFIFSPDFYHLPDHNQITNIQLVSNVYHENDVQILILNFNFGKKTFSGRIYCGPTKWCDAIANFCMKCIENDHNASSPFGYRMLYLHELGTISLTFLYNDRIQCIYHLNEGYDPSYILESNLFY